MKKLLLTAALLSAAFTSNHALGQTPAAPSATVSYGDLDLGTAAGRATLQSRLNAAVRQVCPNGSTWGVHETFERQRCLRIAGAEARRQAAVVLARVHQDGLRTASLAAR